MFQFVAFDAGLDEEEPGQFFYVSVWLHSQPLLRRLLMMLMSSSGPDPIRTSTVPLINIYHTAKTSSWKRFALFF